MSGRLAGKRGPEPAANTGIARHTVANTASDRAACVISEPVYHEMAADLGGTRFMQISISQEREIVERYGIDAVPTLLYFRNGHEVARSVGSMERKGLHQYIGQILYQ